MKIGASYIPPHQPIHIEADMRYMKGIGCNQVLFALQENHIQWLNSSVRFGPQIAKDYGMFVRAVLWGYANTSGGGRSSRVMLENPDMWRFDVDGKPFMGGYLNPRACHNNPKTISFFADYIEQCGDYGFESIMIDEPTVQDCFCGHCRKKFYDSYKMDMILIEEGCPDMVTAWSFRGGIGLADLSSEECDNPQLAWDSIERLYMELAAERSMECLQA